MRTAFSTWLRVSRANFLPVSLLPFALGSALAGRAVPFSWARFLAGAFAVAAVHLAANLLNEYWDHLLQADGHGKSFAPHFGGSRSIQSGLVPAVRVRATGYFCLALGLAAGAALAAERRSVGGLLFVAAGAFLAWAYTARPLSLAYRGAGEAAVFAAFGLLVVNGGYLVQAGRAAPAPLLLSLASGFLISSLLLANEIADSETDRAAGKMNWAARFGRKPVARAVGVFAGLPFPILLLGCALKILPSGFLAAFLVLPVALAMIHALQAALKRGGGFEKSSSLMVSFYAAYHAAMIAIALLT